MHVFQLRQNYAEMCFLLSCACSYYLSPDFFLSKAVSNSQGAFMKRKVAICKCLRLEVGII